ncbi:MAG: phospho-N-acetylmuramoyl-pentapeptide-transferase [Bacteroidetes bacterium]|jgi:phospho-N-acetylmuramoyl-pentapeptide-transferase|nr:phospho-N-acetylmuramoyl-pentapeptide-transferase [Bacteroidota bacterium]MBK6819978.1 phospho-N-acetylmuramoyl-pentapeptide-transferase [Bacteroidota bacterium]MBK7042084.1 phospho-N-acetylmuramoyl-pentapeptide-transferase [Bacteroidota bacterium]MBK7588091.1 phospho-N-acetylmuramoyl-pentapeptide-transferase [Bacteroidota bacterium]MBK8330770.1 phospho-N-acetylmuramoyl-pentapeptide-transferase [Bacteroidota bacterium]
MLYYLFTYLRENFGMPGVGVFYFISFRAAMSIILSLVISLVYGKRLIKYLHKKQIGETVRDLGLEGEKQKSGTPTMGGIIIIAAILIPTLLFARIQNVYIILMLISTIWLGLIGFLDDYIKVFKKNKEGLAGRFKVLGQIGLGIIVGLTMYYNQNVYITRETTGDKPAMYSVDDKVVKEGIVKVDDKGVTRTYARVKSVVTTIPFAKNHELSYSKIASWFGEDAIGFMTPIIYILFVIFIIVAVSNGANITDGLDGLATGTSAIIGICLALFAYLSGNFNFAKYLNIMQIPNIDELSIFIGAFVGACIGFLWYNSYPAQVFMGDTGSLALGGIIASLAIIIRKELLIPIICGVFFIENVSVMIQVAYFKWTKKRYGEGRRIFLMAPLHHHYQKMGYHESKIAIRFWIIGIVLAVLSVVTLKLQ